MYRPLRLVNPPYRIKVRCMQQGLNLRRSMRRTDYESVAFDHSAIHAAAILSIKIGNCKIVNFHLEITGGAWWYISL